MFLGKHFRNRNVCSKDNHCDDKGIWEDVRHQREIRHAQRGKTEIKKKKILLGYEYVRFASSRKRRYSPRLLVAQSLNFLVKKENVKGASHLNKIWFERYSNYKYCVISLENVFFYTVFGQLWNGLFFASWFWKKIVLLLMIYLWLTPLV